MLHKENKVIRITVKIIISLVTFNVLIGCNIGSLFEQKIYGVPESVWATMGDSQRTAAIKAYRAKQARLAEEARIQALQAERNLYITRLAQQDYQQYYRSETNEFFINKSTHYYQLSYDERRTYDNIMSELIRERRQQAAIRQQQEQNRRAYEQANLARQEALNIEEAKRRSMITYQQEQNRRAQEQANLARQEALDIEEAKRRSMITYQQEQANRRNNTDSQNWAPNEGQLVRAGELIMELQRELGCVPASSQVNNRLSSRMGLSSAQSQKIIDELGLY